MHLASSWAIELSQLHMPMTRDEADVTLSKDYESSVMYDGTIRRTWKQDGMTVFVDFNSETQEAVLIAVIYDKPVPRKKGIADAHAIAAGKFSKEAKWDPPKDADARQMVHDVFGLENALRKKLKDKSMLFVETDESRKRIVRVSLFSRMPSTNRWTLKPISRDAQSTAMGENWTPQHLAALYKDEERRRTLSLKPDDPSSSPSSTAPTSTKPADDTLAVTTPRLSARMRAPRPWGKPATHRLPDPPDEELKKCALSSTRDNTPQRSQPSWLLLPIGSRRLVSKIPLGGTTSCWA